MHGKHAIFWSTSNTLFYEAHQARKHTKVIEHASTPSTQNMSFSRLKKVLSITGAENWKKYFKLKNIS